MIDCKIHEIYDLSKEQIEQLITKQNTTITTIKNYFRTIDFEQRMALARRGDLNSHLYFCLFDLDNKAINISLACNTNCPKEILYKLSKKEDWNKGPISLFLVENISTDDETLCSLADRDDFCLNYSIMIHKNIGTKTLDSLSKSKEEECRVFSAFSPLTEETTLMRLSSDVSEKVRAMAKKHKKYKGGLAQILLNKVLNNQ